MNLVKLLLKPLWCHTKEHIDLLGIITTMPQRIVNEGDGELN